MQHFTSFFSKFQSNLPVKTAFFMLKAAFAMAILDLISHLQLTYVVCLKRPVNGT
jgi:hypothetical protein